MDHRSMIVFTTEHLMDLCRAHRHASIDGTYRCAPGKATIANFGVFLGRSYLPCFMGIMSGERSCGPEHRTRSTSVWGNSLFCASRSMKW